MKILRKIFIVVMMLAAASVNAKDGALFYFNFKDAAGKNSISASCGSDFKCVSDQYPFHVEHGGLRIAPAANIYITGNFPDLSKELTVSLWFLRQSWDTPLLMRGFHNGAIDFLLSVRWCFPAFSYKDPNDRSRWEGLYVLGPIPREMHYGKKEWFVPGGKHVKGGEWTNCQVTYKEGETRIYIDGVLTCQNISQCRQLTSTSSRIYIGSERLSPNAVNGYLTADMLINDIRLFDRALSPAELQEIYRAELSSYREHGKISLEKTNAYSNPDYDPEFRRKLPITEKYEREILPGLRPPKENLSGKAELLRHNDAPVLRINDRNYYPTVLSPPRDLKYLKPCVMDFAAAGVELVNISISPYTVWLGDKKYDFSYIDEAARNILATNPQAKMLIWIRLSPSTWFIETHPEELEQSYANHKLVPGIGGGPLGSDLWEQKVGEYLTDLVRYVEASAYGKQVYAYLPGGGESGEWYWPGAVYGHTPGYSKATMNSFRQWVRREYDDNVQRLREAWKMPDLTFDDVTVPALEAREQVVKENFFNDPAQGSPIRDFRRYMTARTVESIKRCAAIIKKNTDRKKLVFLYSGYTLPATAGKLINSGLNGTAEVLASPDIDVLVTPMTYSYRKGGQEGVCVNPWVASARLHGKLVWQEDDLRTHFASLSASGASETLEETIEVIRRGFGFSLTRNQGLWWLLFEPAWFHQEEIMQAIAQIQAEGKQALSQKRTPLNEVAFIWDENSLFYLNRTDNNFFQHHGDMTYLNSMRMGAPASFYLLDDFNNPAMPEYKLYIFLNAYKVSRAQQELIINKIRKNNAVAVWCYAPGYLTDDGYSTESMRQLSGFNLKKEDGRHTLQLRFGESGGRSPITQYAKNQPPYEVSPAFFVDDQKAEVLAAFGGRTVLATKEMDGWRSVYSLLPLSRELLMGLCDYAGVHVYCRSFDVVSANAGYLMLHSSTPGEKIVELPASATVTEVLSGNVIGCDVRRFVEKVAKNQTRIYRLQYR